MNEQQPPNEGKSTSGRSLLASSYKSFDPYDVGDRYVTFLLDNEPTLEKLTGCVLKDHLKRIDNETNGKMEGRSDESIEIDAYQLMNLDPVLGNLTLRYPDTLLSLLEDSTVQARKVLRRRMEVALSESMKHANQKQSEKQQSEKQQLASNKKNQQLLHSLQQNTTYEPRPLRARLTHLPPHHQCCKPTLSSISSSDVGTVLQISGTCVRTGPVRMMETIRTYKCLECGNDFEVQADFGTTNNALPAPIVCPAEFDEYSCKGTNFKIVDRASHHCDYQEIKVQESAGALTRVGSVPRSILIKLTDDLVDKCNPGDEVVVVGSLHAEWQSGTSGFVDNLEIMVGMSVQAHSVRIVNVDEEMAGGGPSMSDLNAFSGSGGLGSVSGNLRERFRREFDAFWNNEEAKQRPFATRDYILRAVCPKLFGMHAVKLGLLLALIGGASVSNDNEYADMSEDGERHLESEHLPIDDNDSTPAPFEAGPVAFNFGGDIDDSDDQSKDNLKRKRDDQSGSKYKSNNQGKAVRSRRRVQSHILLIGDPGEYCEIRLLDLLYHDLM
jgi:DNA helicase MCM9